MTNQPIIYWQDYKPDPFWTLESDDALTCVIRHHDPRGSALYLNREQARSLRDALNTIVEDGDVDGVTSVPGFGSIVL